VPARWIHHEGEPMQVVIEGLRRVLRGEVCVSSQLNSRILGSYVTKKEPKLRSPIELLSDRELEVFELIGQGLSTREAAGKLHLSMKTVSCYRENIKISSVSGIPLNYYAMRSTGMSRPALNLPWAPKAAA